MSIRRSVALRIQRFAKAEEGGMTVLSLFLVMAMLVVIGIAIDTSRLQARTTMLQVTADSAAYAAASRRVFSDQMSATGAALQNASANMPADRYGNVLMGQDIEWGVWDTTNRVFRTGAIVAGTTPNAVRVTVRQTQANGNPFTNILLGWVGVHYAEPVRRAVVALNPYDKPCLREGFVAQGTIDIQSNNTFKAGFCIHSNTGVKVSSGGIFEPGVTVSMPNPDTTANGGNLQLPSSGFTSNVGLQDALEPDNYQLYTLTQMERIINSMRANPTTSPFLPDYATNRTIQRIGGNQINGNTTLDASDLLPNNIYVADCANSGTRLTLAKKGGGGNASTTIRQVVLITNCMVNFGSNTNWEDSILASTNTDTRAIDGSQGMRLGSADGCQTGGGAQIMTMGGMVFPSSMAAYGVQLLAKGDVSFTASGNGVQGISIVAGGTVSGTSGMTMANCGGGGMEDNIVFPVPMLVE